MLVALIAACEVGFWVALLAGLATRYLLRRPRLSVAILLGVPLLDAVLLVAGAADLLGGATADFTHGLAAVYLATSLAFGHSMIKWADVRFAHRFADGPPPEKPPKGGPEHARRQRGNWLRHLLAWGIGCGLMMTDVLIAGEERTQQLLYMAGLWTVILAIDFVWSFSYTLWPKKTAD
jgi:hypothetical protein